MGQLHMKLSFFETLKDAIVPGHNYYFSWIKPYCKNKKIIDIGCWIGTMEYFLQRITPSVVGIELEEEAYRQAKRNFPKFKFIKGSILESLPLDESEFEIALFFMVIEHLPSNTELKALQKINKYLKKEGSLFLSTMSDNLFSKLLDPAYFISGHRHYSEESLRKLLSQSGFEVEEVRYNGGIFTTSYILLLYFFKHLLKRKLPQWRFLYRLMELDYRDRGFVEIGIRAKKIKEAYRK